MKYTTGLPTPKFADLYHPPARGGRRGLPAEPGAEGLPEGGSDPHAPQCDIGGDRRAAGCVLAHDLAGHQGPDRGDHPGPEGRAAHRRRGPGTPGSRRLPGTRREGPGWPARAAAPAARCGPAPGGRLHPRDPRADTARGSRRTAFVAGPVLPPHRRLGHQQSHGQQRGQRPRAGDLGAQGPRGRRHPGPRPTTVASACPSPCTGRLFDEGAGRIGRKPWAPPTRAPPPGPRASPCKRGARSGATAPGTATAQWVNRRNRT